MSRDRTVRAADARRGAADAARGAADARPGSMVKILGATGAALASVLWLSAWPTLLASPERSADISVASSVACGGGAGAALAAERRRSRAA